MKVSLAHPVLWLPVLDVGCSLLLDWGLRQSGWRVSLAGLWVVSLLRLSVLTVTGALAQLPGSPGSLRPRDLHWFTVVVSLVVPVYLSLGPLAPELLWGSARWQLIIPVHLVTALAALVWRRFVPEEEEEEEEEEGKVVNGGSAGSPQATATAGLARLLSCFRPDLGRFAIMTVFLVISSLGEMAIPYYTGRLTDWLNNKDSHSNFTTAIITMAFLSIVSAVMEFLCDGIYNVTMSRIHTRIQSDVFRSVLKQDIGFFDAVHTGAITSRITTDTNTMSEALSDQLSLLLWYLMRIACLFVFMLSLSVRLSLFTAFGIPIILLIPDFAGDFYQSLSAKVQSSLAAASQVAMETFSAMRTVRSLAGEECETQRYQQRLQLSFQLNQKESLAYAGYMCLSNLSGLALKVAVLCYGGQLVASGAVTSGDLVSFILYEMQFTSAVQVLISVYPNVRRAVGASEKVFDYMDREPVQPPAGTRAPQALRGLIEFKDVTFCYPQRPDTPVLKNVSFELRPGEITALVGASGSGKTTCVCLLERFYQPQAGQILLDGKPIEEYEHHYYHKAVGLVSQEPTLFARSVQKNISYGLRDASLRKVINAAKSANASSFISNLKDRYDTDAGEKGAQLSGGQKQRVAIARALILNPRVLILDDATSSLDVESEHMVQETVFQRSGDRALLVIAHRMSSVENADQILVLENGRIVQRGRHQELLLEDGIYKRLRQNQLQGFGKNRDMVTEAVIGTGSAE